MVLVVCDLFFSVEFCIIFKNSRFRIFGSAPVKKYVRKGGNILQKWSISVATESRTSRKLPTSWE